MKCSTCTGGLFWGPTECRETKALICSSPADAFDVEVDALAVDASHIFYVQSSITQHFSPLDDRVAAKLLDFFVTLPYAGADPTRAKAWLDANIGAVAPQGQSGAEIDIGPVRWSISKRLAQQVYVLEMAPRP